MLSRPDRSRHRHGRLLPYLHSEGWTWGDPLDWNSPLYKEATTVTFAGIVAAQVANVFACRSDRFPAFPTRLGQQSIGSCWEWLLN